MSLVIDGSVMLAWCFADETTPSIDKLVLGAARSGATVASIWRLEVANGLRSGVRRRRITSEMRDGLLADIIQMMFETDPHTDRHAWNMTLALSDRHGLTPYDACYLELAMRRQLPIATLDRALAQAARTEGVQVFDALK